ncbi:MAG TPA: glycosyltransferase family 4 protein [Ferruginibacter sp.]|nr:glycosyltransferase family 4 protein [Ferruginibacter sp.]HRO17253.1 glycosyltransferase family 4 protein [Ferruginibacter sp.]HRQ20873.1 glycosyltransferase family 4 protein [Ferruginibacter sp.]
MTRTLDAVCAIDLDTILPCYLTSVLRKKKRIYDAHELFCEMKEISSRPFIYNVWKMVEKWTVPHFKLGYCVNHYIAGRFREMYHVEYIVIRNMPLLKTHSKESSENFILYQGAVNEGRCFETLIPAMQWIDTPLWIVGDGNFMEQVKTLVSTYGVAHKVHFKGMIPPAELRQLTPKAKVGFTLFEPDAESNYYSLANRFFDYIHAGVPQVCVDYPAYREIYNQFNIGVLIEDVSPKRIAAAVNQILDHPSAAARMREACIKAAAVYNWQTESQTLINYYQEHIG